MDNSSLERCCCEKFTYDAYEARVLISRTELAYTTFAHGEKDGRAKKPGPFARPRSAQ